MTTRRDVQRSMSWPKAISLLPLLLTGCHSLAGKQIDLPAEAVRACDQTTMPCRNKVHVFVLEGIEPGSRSADVRASLIASGFIKVYNGQFYHVPGFGEEIQRLHAQDPEARFVVLGIGSGVDFAKSLVRAAAKQNVPIELFAAMNSTWWNREKIQDIPNVARTLEFTHSVSVANALVGESNPNTNDAKSPMASSDAIGALTTALSEIANSMPRNTIALGSPRLDEAPTPRPRQDARTARADDWDFLLPVARLSDLNTPTDRPESIPNPLSERTVLKPESTSSSSRTTEKPIAPPSQDLPKP